MRGTARQQHEERKERKQRKITEIKDEEITEEKEKYHTLIVSP
jgi:hypothetical protein